MTGAPGSASSHCCTDARDVSNVSRLAAPRAWTAGQDSRQATAGRAGSGGAPRMPRCSAPSTRSSRFPSSSSRCSSAGASATSSPSRCAGARARREWVFYEGPPTANGPPGVPPRAGARVQGHLPALQDDARLPRASARAAGTATACRSRSRSSRSSGFTNKARDRGATAIAEFNRRCRESVFEYLEEWDRLTERIGFWVDLDDAYRTLDDTYIESVWWALAQIYAKGLLYESNRVVPYCPRCGTALSSHEVSLGYEDVVDATRLREAAAGRRATSRS